MQARKAATVEGLLARKNGQARDEAAATARLGREVLGRRAEAAQACERAAMAWRLYEHQRRLLEVRGGAAWKSVAGSVGEIRCDFCEQRAWDRRYHTSGGRSCTGSHPSVAVDSAIGGGAKDDMQG